MRIPRKKWMNLAIIDDNDQVFVQYSETVFRQLIKKYFQEFNDIDKAFDEVSMRLRELTYRK
jgi:hypothetical protein